MSRLSSRLKRLETGARPACMPEILFYSQRASANALRRFDARLAEAVARGARVIVGVTLADPIPAFPAGVEVMEAGQAYMQAVNAVGAPPRKPASAIPQAGMCSTAEAADLYRQIMLDEVPA